MALRIVIVGPGRVGSALGARFARAGANRIGASASVAIVTGATGGKERKGGY